MIFICRRCLHETKLKGNMNMHLNRRKQCNIAEYGEDISCNELLKDLYPSKKYKCICGKEYTHASGLSCHKRTCEKGANPVKSKRITQNELYNIIGDLQEQVTSLQNKNITPVTNNSHNTIDSNNTTNNITNNFILNNHGDENLDFLVDEIIRKNIEQHPSYGVEQLSKMVHFNIEYPENTNILLNNSKDSMLKIFYDGRWQKRDKNETIVTVIEYMQMLRKEVYDKIKHELSQRTKDAFEYCNQKIEEQDPKFMKDFIKRIIILFVNMTSEYIERQK